LKFFGHTLNEIEVNFLGFYDGLVLIEVHKKIEQKVQAKILLTGTP